MENTDQSNRTATGGDKRARIFFAISLSIFLYGAYFWNLVRQQHLVMVQKQAALESIKAIAVPGTVFLNHMGSLFLLKSSLFFLVLLGVMFLAFMLLSLIFESPKKRASFLVSGLFILVILTINDRVNISFLLVISLSFASFYLLTLPHQISFSLREISFFMLLMILITSSLFYGSKNRFFVKTRDKVLFDSALGNKIISFYYTYSPLAASLVSREQSVYQGLIFHEGIKNERFLYLDKGIFLTGKKEVKGAVDFVISKQGEGFFIKNRYGKAIPIESINITEIEKAIGELFSMKGFSLLNKIGLYFFPAGLLILFLMGIKLLTDNKKIFVISSTGIASALVLFIWFVSLTGNNPPGDDRLKSVELSRDGLSIAYYLYAKNEIPEPYIPFVKMMTKSESPSLRYWGAHLLGILGDKKDAQTLISLLEDPSLNVRYMASHSLYTLLKEESYRTLLIHLLKDPSWYVRCRIFSIFLNTGTIPSPA